MSHDARFHLAGLMGFPVMHSRSPLIHGHWMREHGLKGAYVPLAVPPAGLEAALHALPSLGFASKLHSTVATHTHFCDCAGEI